MTACPNYKSPEWLALVSALGKQIAYKVFIAAEKKNTELSMEAIEEVIAYYKNKFQQGIVDSLDSSNVELRDGEYVAHTDTGEKVLTTTIDDIVAAKTKIAQKTLSKEHTNIRNAMFEALNMWLNDSVVLDVVKEKPDYITAKDWAVISSWAREFISDQDSQSRIYINQNIADIANNRAGTADIIIIKPSGEADIYQLPVYKLFEKQAKEINSNEQRVFDGQLSQILKILRDSYGVTSFGKTRTIPITQNLDKRGYSLAIDGKTRPEESIHISPSIYERTGEEKIDELLNKLIAEHTSLEEASAKGLKGEEYVQKREHITARRNAIRKAIKDIQTKNSFDSFIYFMQLDKKLINIPNLENLDDETLLKNKELATQYTNIVANYLGTLLDNETLSAEQGDIIGNLQIFFSRLKARYDVEANNRVIDTAGEHAFDVRREPSWWARNLRTISQNQHPLIQAFWNKLIKPATRGAIKELDATITLISEKVNNLETWASANGVTLKVAYLKILTLNSNNQYTRIPKYKKEFYETRDALLEDTSVEGRKKAIQWLKDNLVTREDKDFIADTLDKKTILKIMYLEGEIQDEERYNNELKDYYSRYGNLEDLQNNQALLNVKNFYLRPSDAWISDEIKELQLPGNEALLDFYNIYDKYTKEFEEILGEQHNSRRIWHVKDSLIIRFLGSGAGFKDMGMLLQGIGAGQKDFIYSTNEKGEKIRSIPKYFIDPLDKSESSVDLGKTLLMAAQMAYSYRNFSNIEASSKLLLEGLQNAETYQTSQLGGLVTDKLKGDFAKFKGNKAVYELFEKYINYHIYGERTQNKDFGFTLFGRKFSVNKSLDVLNKYIVINKLSLAPLSVVINGITGQANILMLAAGGKYFKLKDVQKSLNIDIPFRDKKSIAFLGFLDLNDTERIYKKIQKVGYNKLANYINADTLLAPMHESDKWIRHGVALGMAKHFTVKGDRIVIAKPGDTTIWDMVEYNDGSDSFDVPGLSEEAFNTFRNKAFEVGNKVLGNTSRDDIKAAGLNSWFRSILVFRNWIPRSIDERFGETRFNTELDEYEVGRYRSFATAIWNKEFPKMMVELAAIHFGGSTNGLENRARDLAVLALVDNPGLLDGRTKEEYIEEYTDVYISNLKAMMIEMILIIAFLLLSTLGFDRDRRKKKAPGTLLLRKLVDREYMELAFYLSPSQAASIMKSPMPAMSTFSTVQNLFKSFAEESTEAITGKNNGANNLPKYFLETLPIGSSIAGIERIVNPDWVKEEKTK